MKYNLRRHELEKAVKQYELDEDADVLALRASLVEAKKDRKKKVAAIKGKFKLSNE